MIANVPTTSAQSLLRDLMRQSALTMPNAKRFVYTLCRAAFSPMSSTGGRYILAGGCGGAQIFDIVGGSAVATLAWDDAGSADEVIRREELYFNGGAIDFLTAERAAVVATMTGKA